LSSDNAQVHNAGEVWASMLWDCYAALLRDTQVPMPRRDFNATQRQMTEYLLGAYSLTPPQPTYTEARDALLAVIAASDARDLQLCGTAFAQRGAGLRAQAARRDTLSNIGVNRERGRRWRSRDRRRHPDTRESTATSMALSMTPRAAVLELPRWSTPARKPLQASRVDVSRP
jgi:hypothetical protein